MTKTEPKLQSVTNQTHLRAQNNIRKHMLEVESNQTHRETTWMRLDNMKLFETSLESTT